MALAVAMHPLDATHSFSCRLKYKSSMARGLNNQTNKQKEEQGSVDSVDPSDPIDPIDSDESDD